jgi:hypothetical protein
LEQVVTQWNAILFQLCYDSTIYRPVCLFLLIKHHIYNPGGICLWGFSISV